MDKLTNSEGRDFGLPADAPAVDTVTLWLTFSVEYDYIQRNAFPSLRAANAIQRRASSALYYLTLEEAESIREDAQARHQVKRGPGNSMFGSLAAAVGKAIEEARGRREYLTRSEPTCSYRTDFYETWHGTKAQLQGMGMRLVPVDGPWPDEPGGKKRWAKGVDSRGHTVHIKRREQMWGTFTVDIDLPREPAPPPSREQSERDKERTVAERQLAKMPKSAEDYRRDCVHDFRSAVRSRVTWATLATEHLKDNAGHGYSLPVETGEAIMLACDALVEVILGSEVNFNAEQHHRIEIALRSKLSGMDRAFQEKLAVLARPNPKLLLEGSAK